jgi:arginase
MNLLLCAIKQGQLKNGCQYGPSELFHNLKRSDFNCVTKIQDFNVNPYQLIYRETLLSNNKMLVLGGDHSIGLSTVMGSLHKYKRDLKVIWVDAHADINTEESSYSKNKHGMPVSPLFNLMKPWIKTKNNLFLKPEQFVYIGLRNLDKAEEVFISQIGMKAYYANDVKHIGIDKILNSIIRDDKSIYHLSFDIDALDSFYVPSTGTPEPNGLSLDEGKYIVKTLKNTSKLRHYDLVEYNPLIGNKKDNKKTLQTCLSLLENYID